MSAPEHQMLPPEQTSNHIPAPEQMSHQMFQISHPENHIYPSQSHRRQPQSYMDRMMMENHLGMSDRQENMDYIGGRGRMKMYGYGLSGGSDFYSHFQESMD